MKFFLDENFPCSTKPYLEKYGHEVIDMRDCGLTGSDDLPLFEYAQQEKASFLTTDRDFFHTIPHLYAEHYGIIVIALKQPNRDRIKSKLQWFLENIGLSDIRNRSFHLRDKAWVVYPPLS